MTDWSAKQYSRFEAQRNRPISDLLSAISGSDPHRVVDIGCGPGNSTELLAASFPGAAVSGFDSSADMIAAAQKRLPSIPFSIADIAAWDDPGPYDLIFSNAVFQWVPDHAALLPQLVQKLSAGGILAGQMPDNLDEPAHRLMRELADSARWAPKLSRAAAARAERHSAEWYYQILQSLCTRVDVWRTTYFHPLAGPAAVVEWFKGTGLRPFLKPLNAGEQQDFLWEYEALVAGAYPADAEGGVLLPFPRLFFVAVR